MFAGFRLVLARSRFLRFGWVQGAHRMIVRVSGLIACKLWGFIFGGWAGLRGGLAGGVPDDRMAVAPQRELGTTFSVPI